MDKNARSSLFGALSFRNGPTGEAQYILKMIIRACAFAALAIVFIALMMHVLDYGGITMSTHSRQMAEGAIQGGVMLIDDGECLSEKDELMLALEHFEQKTGVTPYLYIYESENDDADVYSLFNDICIAKNSLLVAYNVQSKNITIKSSDGAKTVLDNEAYDIFCDYIAYYKQITVEHARILEHAYRSTAKRIMSKTNIFNCVSSAFYIGILFILIAECIIIFKIITDIKKKMTEKDRREDKNGELQ